MIKHGEFVSYISHSQKWSAAKLEATGDNNGLNMKLFTRLGANFYCNSSDTVFFKL